MADFDCDDWDGEIAQGYQEHQRIDRAPDDAHKLKPWTVVALILNRTIGKLRRGSTTNLSRAPTDSSRRLRHFCHAYKGPQWNWECWSVSPSLGLWWNRRDSRLACLA
jgi:hypothetical protein